MIQQFTKYGYSCSAVDVAIGTSYSAIPLTSLAANNKSLAVPDDCYLESIEFELSAIIDQPNFKLPKRQVLPRQVPGVGSFPE